MPDDLFVEPRELRAAVAEVATATRALENARGALAVAGQLAGGGLDHDGRADDKLTTFVRQWRSEYEIVADLLGAHSDVLTNAAACYEELDHGLAQCLEEAVG